jgi:hypothetical protein
MLRMLRGGTCPAELLGQLYPEAARVCARCTVCRDRPTAASGSPPELEPRAPWAAKPSDEPVRSLFDHAGRVVVTIDESGRSFRRRLGDALVRLARAGMFNIVVFGRPTAEVEMALSTIASTVAFVARTTVLGVPVLPRGPEIVLVGEDASLREVHLGPRVAGSERLILIPANARSPTRPHLPIAESHDGRVIKFRELYSRLLT